MPADFAHVQITQDAARAAGKSGKLSWTCVLRLSEKEDERKKKLRRQPESSQQSHVWFSRPETMTQHSSAYRSGRAGKSSESDGFVPSVMSRVPSRSEQFCGNFHIDVPQTVSSVPERDAHRSGEQSRPTRTFIPSHQQGMRGSARSPPIRSDRALRHCAWCGRYGHKDNNCWERQGRCLFCGDQFHQKDQCLKQREFESHEVCPVCSGPHLGKNCSVGGLNF